MATDTGNCPFCDAENSYKSTHCAQCREELPWANIVRATRRDTDAIGAKRKTYLRPGEEQLETAGGVPSGTLIKALLIIVPLLIMLGSVYFAMNRLSSSGLVSNSPSGNVVQQFKKAVPTE